MNGGKVIMFFTVSPLTVFTLQLQASPRVKFVI